MRTTVVDDFPSQFINLVYFLNASGRDAGHQACLLGNITVPAVKTNPLPDFESGRGLPTPPCSLNECSHFPDGDGPESLGGGKTEQQFSVCNFVLFDVLLALAAATDCAHRPRLHLSGLLIIRKSIPRPQLHLSSALVPNKNTKKLMFVAQSICFLGSIYHVPAATISSSSSSPSASSSSRITW